MAKPRFTDLGKWKVPYVKSGATDVAATFRRIRREMAAQAAERTEKVKQIKRKSA